MPLRHILLALLVVAIWGFNFVVIKLTVLELPPYLSAALRFTLAAFPAILFIKAPKNEHGKTPWFLVISFGLSFGFLLYALLNFALFAGMPAGLGSLVLQVQAFFTMIIAFFILKERPRSIQIFGALIAFSGIGVIGYYRWEGANLFPFILTILAAIAWAMANVITKLAGKINPISLAVWGAAIAAIPLFALSFFIEGFGELTKFLISPNWLIIGMLFFAAYPATLFGLAIWNWLLGKYPTSIVAPFSLLVPITGLFFGWLLIDESISMFEMIGGLLVIIGLGVTVINPKKSKLPPE
jgi:O-acetylserine/cysteine efflux transporter